MIGRVVTLFLLMMLMILALGYLYIQFAPQDPVSLRLNQKGAQSHLIIYGETPLFMESLRFQKAEITYSIESTCDLTRKDSMEEAFQIFQNKMEVISFEERFSDDADILVGCSDDFIKVDEQHFAAGEGGPSEIINTSTFNVIKKGKISLYRESRCDLPVVELHELSHVFGFDHSIDERSIMYPVSDCDQIITEDMVETMTNLYSIKSLPDARIIDLTAVKRGRYLDFNITIVNEGLEDIENIELVMESDNRFIDEFSLGEIQIGYSRTLSAKNVRLSSSRIKELQFILDKDNLVEEISEDNNLAEMVVSS